MKYFIINLICIALLSCGNESKKGTENIDSELVRLDSAKGAFRPDFFTDMKHAHRAFKISFDGTQFTVIPGSEVIRPGDPPFSRNDKSGPYLVHFKDAAGRQVFSYSLDHPGLLRACEGEAPEVHQKQQFIFEVVVPADMQVAAIGVTSRGKRLFESRIPSRRPSRDSTQIR